MKCALTIGITKQQPEIQPLFQFPRTLLPGDQTPYILLLLFPTKKNILNARGTRGRCRLVSFKVDDCSHGKCRHSAGAPGFTNQATYIFIYTCEIMPFVR